MKYLIGGNRKMNKTNADIAEYMQQFFALYQDQDLVDIALCPQMPSLSYTSTFLPKGSVVLGAQNMHYEETGAFTGETSPLLLNELGCKYSIIGHSERRTLFGEDATLINKKLASCIAHGMRPILCIGETLEQRDAGETEAVLTKQFTEATQWIDCTKLDVAYEPVWSIGTGKIPTMPEIEAMHTLIRTLLNNEESRILYGGSSNDQNAAEILTLNNVNGFLVWGASLDPKKFTTMISAIVSKLMK